MSAENVDQDYWNIVDAFLEKANTETENSDVGMVASALMNAAARYSAFYVAGSSESRKDLKEDKDVLVQDISREFKQRFASNLEDYIENYKIYLLKDQEAD
ncbi:MAG: DUF3144 domain-containing protein [Agarilytica sp.]